MKATLFYGCLVAMSLASCAKSVSDKYVINGTATPALEGKMIFLNEVSGRDFIPKDTAFVENGKFSFTGSQDTARNFVIAAERNDEFRAPVYIVLENADYTVALDSVVKADGPALNDSLRALLDVNQALRLELISANRELQRLKDEGTLTPDKEAELKGKVDKINDETFSNNAAFIESNIDNVAGALIFSWNYYNFSAKDQERIISSASDAFNNYPAVKAISDHLNILKR
ncbi:MAG: DUF4369 domain-containing protein, partial [Bacteroidales bacterium]